MYLKTDRLELKSISPDSIESLVELLTDDLVKQTYMVLDFPNREAAVKLAEQLIALSEQEDRYVAGIYFGDALIGILNETEVAGDRIEVGYAILPRFHNQGYCTEALRGTIDYFFSLGFTEVAAGAFAENTASIRAMVKSGMVKLHRQDRIEYRGRIHSGVYYSIKRQQLQRKDRQRSMKC